jgi:hypothetical protein
VDIPASAAFFGGGGSLEMNIYHGAHHFHCILLAGRRFIPVQFEELMQLLVLFLKLLLITEPDALSVDSAMPLNGAGDGSIQPFWWWWHLGNEY